MHSDTQISQISRRLFNGDYQAVGHRRMGHRLGPFRIVKWHAGTCGCFVIFRGDQRWYSVPRVIVHQGSLGHSTPVPLEEGMSFLEANIHSIYLHPDLIDVHLEQELCTHVFPGGRK